MTPIRLLVWAVLLALLVLAGILGEAHYEIRSIAPPLPTRAELDALASTPGGPVRIRYVNTATQPNPDGSELVHPGFLLEWADGRALLIDVGMDRPGAVAFGEPMEWLLGADAAQPLGSVGEQMGEDARRIAAVAFTHLHHDHTGGIGELCDAAGRQIVVYQTPWQAEYTNFGSELGAEDVRAVDCVTPERLEIATGGRHYAIPGFDGLFAVAGGGHTPGSTIYLARVGSTFWILAGDVSNAKSNLLGDVPKPLLYSWLIVPEDRERLGVLRRWLAGLDAEPATRVIVSHDGGALRESGMAAY